MLAMVNYRTRLTEIESVVLPKMEKIAGTSATTSTIRDPRAQTARSKILPPDRPTLHLNPWVRG